jgi:hypothetical protein
MTIFGLKMIVKSGPEFFILKLNEPLQRYLLTCQANSAFHGRFVFALGSSNSEGAFFNLKIKNSKPKIVISRVKSLVHL